MEAFLEIDVMPGPQWLFGFQISEAERLLFARIYVRFARDRPVADQATTRLHALLDLCMANGLTLVVPRHLAIHILLHPEVFSWHHATDSARRYASVAMSTRGCIQRARKLLERTRARERVLP